MHKRKIFLSTTVALLVATPASADRRRPDLLTQEWDELIDETLELTNPLYQDNDPDPFNPLYEPQSISFNAAELWPGTPVRLEVQLDPILPAGVTLPDGAYAFSVKLFDKATGQPITQFPNGVSFCFDLPHLTPAESDDAALGYLDETEDPPKWKTEDKVLEKENNTLCGTTDHFSIFIIGPSAGVPEPGSLALLSLGGLLVARRRR